MDELWRGRETPPMVDYIGPKEKKGIRRGGSILQKFELKKGTPDMTAEGEWKERSKTKNERDKIEIHVHQ